MRHVRQWRWPWLTRVMLVREALNKAGTVKAAAVLLGISRRQLTRIIAQARKADVLDVPRRTSRKVRRSVSYERVAPKPRERFISTREARVRTLTGFSSVGGQKRWILVGLPQSLIDLLDELARRLGQSRSAVIAAAVARYCGGGWRS